MTDEDLIETASCAVTAGIRRWQSDELIEKALRLGIELTQLNCKVPLAALLDAVLISTSPRCPRNPPSPGSPIGASSYATSVRRLFSAVHKLSQRADFVSAMRSDRSGTPIVSLLEAAWEPIGFTYQTDEVASGGSTGVGYEAQLRRMLDRRSDLASAWASPTNDPDVWSRWIPPDSRWPKLNQQLGLRFLHSLFTFETRKLGGIVMRFDHGAAHLYLASRDAKLLPDQERWIKRLRQRRPWPHSLPLTEAIEEPDPRYGVYSLSALLGDTIEQVWFNLQKDPRLNNRPPACPPRVLNVFLGWVGGRQSVISEDSEAALRPEHYQLSPPSGKLSHSSVVQGLVALLLDDWRYFLRSLPVDFHLQRGFPRAEMLFAGRPGFRWKDLSQGNPESVPPADITRLLFRPLRSLDVIRELHNGPARWYEPLQDVEAQSLEDAQLDPDVLPDFGEDAATLRKMSWSCLVVAESDLSSLGFNRIEQPDGQALWSHGGKGNGFCKHFNHAVIVDPTSTPSSTTSDGSRDGWVCDVSQEGNELRALSSNRGARDFPFSGLRDHALDLLLVHLSQQL